MKVPLYARAGIGETWLVNLLEETIEVYREPDSAGYRAACTVRRGETFAAESLPNLELLADDILPPR